MKANSKIVNIISSNGSLVVNSVVALMTTKIIIQYLGLDIFGKLGLILSISNILVTIGNSISGAIARYFVMFINSDKKKVEEIISSALYSNTLFSFLFLIIVLCSVDNDYLFYFLICLSFYFSQLSGVFQCSNFYLERFTSTSIISCISRLLNVFFLYFFLKFWLCNLYAIAISMLISSVYSFFSFYFSFNRNQSTIKIFNSCSFSVHKELFGFTGWMLIAYLSNYLLRSGLFIVVEKYAHESLGYYSILNQISSMILQILSTLTVVSSPFIYKCISNNNFIEAKKYINKFLIGSLFLSVVGYFTFYIFGEKLLTLWLGSSTAIYIYNNFSWVIPSCFFASLNIPISVYLAGINKVKSYGFCILFESIIIIGFLILYFDFLNCKDLDFIFIIISIVTAIKTFFIIPRLYKEKFVFLKDLLKEGSLCIIIFLVLFNIGLSFLLCHFNFILSFIIFLFLEIGLVYFFFKKYVFS